MNLTEAYKILGVARNTDLEEVKKQYKKLAKEQHPDVNKAPDAEAKFKKINEAYQVVSTGESTDHEPPMHTSWEGIFSRQPGFNVQKERPINLIHLHTVISFHESVLGAKQEIKYKRETKCPTCNGQGEMLVTNGCDRCGGKGKVISQNGSVIMVRTCDKCQGRVKTKSCDPCHNAGTIESDVSVNVTIPAGVINENILRLGNMGNFIGSFGPIDQYTDVFLHINVTPEEGLSLEGPDVVSTLQLSLIDALIGCKRKVKTVLGEKDIEIKARSRNKEEVIIPNLGVNKQGSHRVVLDIQYPDDISKLVETLKS